MRSSLLPPLCLLMAVCSSMASAQSFEGPSVRDVLGFTRISQPAQQSEDALRGQVSPDGRQAFIVTRRAEVDSDKNRYDIQLLDVTPKRLAAQRMPKPVTVFSAAVGQDNNYGDPSVKDVHWHGNQTLVFMARLDGPSFQVYRLDLPQRKLTKLTREKNSIVSYAASQDLRRVVYAVQVPNPPLREGTHDVVVDNRSFWSVKFGQNDLRAQERRYQYFVVDGPSGAAARALGTPFGQGIASSPVADISPDGRWALLARWEPDRLAAWASQYPLVEDLSKEFARAHQIDPQGYFSTPKSYVPRRMTAWRLDDGKEQTVVDAPDDALPGGGQARSDRLWQGKGASVVLAGTHLPLQNGARGSVASHVIEYWPDRGQWSVIAVVESRIQRAHSVQGGFVVMDGAKRREFQRQADGGWRELTVDALAQATHQPAWALRVMQGLNQPPDVYAHGPSGAMVRLTELNPQFKADTWGAMRPYAWRDPKGRQWEGGLMYGKGMDPQVRYPLLIQTYGFTPDRFYLDGPNTADGYSSGFAGRAFLREGILVLAMPWRHKGGDTSRTERENLQDFNEGVRGAVNALVKEGRVDPSRVGIIGFSATGARVLDLVTFGDVPIRAATMADGDAYTLFSYTLTYAFADETWWRKEQVNGGPAFRDTMADWVRTDPALHTDCIRAAMRIESYGPWVLNNWDVYALLRRQYKAAEMVVFPGGTHSLGTPGDRMASLQGNVDWHSFWLTGKTRAIPVVASETKEALKQRFKKWHHMEMLKAVDDARPACVR